MNVVLAAKVYLLEKLDVKLDVHFIKERDPNPKHEKRIKFEEMDHFHKHWV